MKSVDFTVQRLIGAAGEASSPRRQCRSTSPTDGKDDEDHVTSDDVTRADEERSTGQSYFTSKKLISNLIYILVSQR